MYHRDLPVDQVNENPDFSSLPSVMNLVTSQLVLLIYEVNSPADDPDNLAIIWLVYMVEPPSHSSR